MAIAENLNGEERSLLRLVAPSPEVMQALGEIRSYMNFSSDVRMK
jgi:hypothetical protein